MSGRIGGVCKLILVTRQLTKSHADLLIITIKNPGFSAQPIL
jgi:hypothetical protein